jgi:hypothetical protein
LESDYAQVFLAVAPFLSVPQVSAGEATKLFSDLYASLGISYQKNNIFHEIVQADIGTPSFD